MTIIIIGSIAIVYLMVTQVVPAGLQKRQALKRLEEGGAFAASQLSSPDQILIYHEEKKQQDEFDPNSIVDVLQRQNREARNPIAAGISVEDEGEE